MRRRPVRCQPPFPPPPKNQANSSAKPDRPFTDLYETEGDGGYPGIYFKARPVVGGHFAFLALERACGGKAVEALRFLDHQPAVAIDIEQALRADMPERDPWASDL